jgi:glycosyltransferase involved in cell wall biosynthesis
MVKIYRGSTVITISDSSRDELSAAGFNPLKVFVANPSLSYEVEKLAEQVLCNERKKNRIIYVGRLKKYKGIDVLIQAVNILRNTLPVELLIVGRGDYEYALREIVRSLGLENTVKFTGFLDEAEKIQQLKSASVFACCSIDEGGWTIAGLEAMRCGLPLVVTYSQKDLVNEGITGHITLDSASPDVIAEKIRDLIEGNWQEMSLKSREFSLTITAEESAKKALSALYSARTIE